MALEAPITGTGESACMAHSARKPAIPKAGKSTSRSRSPKRRSRVRPKTTRNRHLPARWKTSACNAEAVMSRYKDRKGWNENRSGMNPPSATASACEAEDRNSSPARSALLLLTSSGAQS